MVSEGVKQFAKLLDELILIFGGIGRQSESDDQMTFTPFVVWVVNVFHEVFTLCDTFTSGIWRLVLQIRAEIPNVAPNTAGHWATFLNKRWLLPSRHFYHRASDKQTRRMFKMNLVLERVRRGLRVVVFHQLGNCTMQWLESGVFGGFAIVLRLEFRTKTKTRNC